VGFARQRQDVTARFLHIGRLVQQFVAKRQGLVGADDERVGESFADIERLRLRQNERNVLGRRPGFNKRRLGGALVDLGRMDVEFDAGVLEKLLAIPAAGGEDDAFWHGENVLSGLPC
jgi:hypothetical protein